MKPFPLIRFIFILFFLFKADILGQTRSEEINRDYNKITATELLKLISNKNDSLLIDNRTHREYDEGHIPGAILIPVDSYTFDRTSRVGEVIQTIMEKENFRLHFVLKDSLTNEQYISSELLKAFLNFLPAYKDRLTVLYDRKPSCTRSPTQEEFDLVEKRIKGLLENVLSAPVYVAVLVDALSKYPEEYIYCGTLAAENIFIAARFLGYGTGFYTAFFPNDEMKKFFNIPEQYRLICFTPIGVPDKWPEMPPKKSSRTSLFLNPSKRRDARNKMNIGF
jgi:rhodanese-related sulfurtransferase